MHLLLYDGECGLCNVLVRTVLAHDQRGVFHYASLQSPMASVVLDRFGSDPNDLNTFYLVVNYRSGAPSRLIKGKAALFLAASLGWPWKAAGLLRVLPNTVLDGIYDLIARNRYRVFGRGERCMVARPEQRERFVDSLPAELGER